MKQVPLRPSDLQMRVDVSPSQASNKIVTIYGDDRVDHAAIINIPLQQKFTGPTYVLTSTHASTPCSELSIEKLLNQMNTIFHTEYTRSVEMDTLLQYCLKSCKDFGFAYALLHPRWSMRPSKAYEDIGICRTADEKLREAAIRSNVIVRPDIPPRRLWDLWSNRVVPIWMTTPDQGLRNRAFFAVSHSWVEDDRRQNVETPINGHEWPVPIPCDSTLERIRVELLNYTFKHELNCVWLDVLCLRQFGSQKYEEKRLEEWKLDVPTIGTIYPDASRVVYYYSGLGRPFKAEGFDSPRHWQNRAWTMQETSANDIIAGISCDSPSMPSIDNKDAPLDEALRPFYDKIDVWSGFSHVVDSVFTVLEAMRHRSATSELDKIAGLNYYLAKFSPLPVYIAKEEAEDAWSRLIQATHAMQRADLFFLFPQPGTPPGKHIWCPSWQQVKDAPTLPSRRTLRQNVELNEDSGVYNVTGYRLDRCWIEGLGKPTNSATRTGTLTTIPEGGNQFRIDVIAEHEHPIPDGLYALIGGKYYPDHWVVAQINEEPLGRFVKISVVSIKGNDAIRRLTNTSKLVVSQLM